MMMQTKLYLKISRGNPAHYRGWVGCFLGILLIPCLIANAYAGQWQLEQDGEQYHISVKSSHGDHLILSHEDDDTRFVLITNTRQEQPDEHLLLQYWFDDDTSITETHLTPLGKSAFLLNLNKIQKNKVIEQMINRVNMQMRYLVSDRTYRDMSFTLLGFTAVLNDMLIAHEIGHLDPEWLNENHKTQELMCYYAANFSVQAMLHRKRGLPAKQSIGKLKKRYANVLDEVISDIVTQVYRLPHSRLPKDPRGDKFGIFKRCMQSYNN